MKNLNTRKLAAQSEVTPRDHDALVAMGELASSRIVAAAFAERGVPAVWVDARRVLVTDADHTQALPDMDATLGRTREELGKRVAAGQVPVTGGFIGATASGVTTTLGRGGSDTTAVALASALGAEVCEIYTDVDGVFTADPRIVPTARQIPKLSYEEMLEMAASGAKILHLRCVEYARRFNLPIHVRSSCDSV